MLERIPVGTYFPGASVLHRLQGRTKLSAAVFISVELFIANHLWWHYLPYAIAAALLSVAVILSRVPPLFLLRRLWLPIVLIALAIIPTLCFTPGNTYAQLGPVVVTYAGLWFAFTLPAVVLMLLVASLLITLTTRPAALTEGLVMLLQPLRWLRLPVDEFALMALIALRFAPILTQEADQLLKAQIARGADFRHGALGQRLRTLGALFVPLVRSVLRRSQELATALEARGYGIYAGRAPLYEGRLSYLDWLVLVLALLPVVGILYRG